MASVDSFGSKKPKQRVEQTSSSTALANKKNWLTNRIGMGLLGKKQDEFTQRQVRRRLLFEKSSFDEDGEEVMESVDFVVGEENINDIVDQDESDLANVISGRILPDFLCSIWFRVVVYLAISLNAIILGLETVDWFRHEYVILTEVIKEVILAFFVCEILLKWYCGFWLFWKSNWNIVDFIVVALSAIGPHYRYVSCGRILRLMRACFMLRAVSSFDKLGILKGLTTIIDTLLISMPEMINIGLLLLLFLLIMAIATKTLLDKENKKFYGDLGSAFFSLFVVTTQDGIVIQYTSLEGHDLWVRSVAAVIFIVVILIGGFIFVNIIVGISCYNLDVVCAAAEGRDQEENEEQKTGEKNLTGDSSDDPAAEFLEKLQCISKNRAQRGINLAQLQKPFQLTNLSNLTVGKLEKYLLILSALEENMAEYEDIKRDLEELYELVKNLNLLDVVQGFESSSTVNVDPAAMGKISGATKLPQGGIGVGKRRSTSDHDMRHLMDMLKRSSLRKETPLPMHDLSKETTADQADTTMGAGVGAGAGAEATGKKPRRPSVSSDSSQGRKRLSPSDAVHPSPPPAKQ